MESQKTMKLNKLNQKNTMESQKIIKSQEIMQTKKIRQTKEIVKSNKITLAILASLSCLLLLFSGVNNLQAQEARQQGWSIGVSPFYLGAKIKTTTENTTLTEIVTTRTKTLTSTGPTFSTSTTDTNVSSGATAGAEAFVDFGDSRHGPDYDTIAIDSVEDICKDGRYDGAGTYRSPQFDVASNADATASNGEEEDCFNHFQLLRELVASFSPSIIGTVVDSSSTYVSVSNENTSLAGNGLQLGYDFEKFRVSFSLHQWSAGDDKLNSQIVIVDYFLPYGLYAGAGLAQAKLETPLGSDSKIAPAIHFGYKRNFSKNFSIEAGLLWLGAKFSVKQTNAAQVPRTSVAPMATPGSETVSVLVGGFISSPNSALIGIGFLDDRNDENDIFSNEDRRILVKGTTPTYGPVQTDTDTYNETVPTKTTIEVEAPASLFIRFVYLFK